MSASESYDATKLLNNLNITNWDHHLREMLSAYPIMGKAIRKGIPYEAIKPTVDDLFQDGARMYSYRRDSTNLDNESRKDFLSACTDFKKIEARRNDQEAKICALITSSFSEEAKMLLRSNKTYVLAADDNDSFAMYTIVKAAHTRVTSFAVAQHAFENLFKITMIDTFVVYSDALSNARLTFDAIFDPTATGTMPIDNIFTMIIVNGLPERFRYMKDRLYSQDLNGAFPPQVPPFLQLLPRCNLSVPSAASPSPESSPKCQASHSNVTSLATTRPAILQLPPLQLFQHQLRSPPPKANSRKPKQYSSQLRLITTLQMRQNPSSLRLHHVMLTPSIATCSPRTTPSQLPLLLQPPYPMSSLPPALTISTTSLAP